MRLLLLSLLLSPVAALAHGDSPSLEAETGPYLIDIGYDVLAAGAETEFNLDLFHRDTLDFADFATVEMRVSQNGAVLTAGETDNDRVNIPVMLVHFPEAGGYDMDVRYVDEEKKLIAAHTFHLEVPGSSAATMLKAEETLHYVIAAGLFALSAGIAGYALWQRYGKKR